MWSKCPIQGKKECGPTGHHRQKCEEVRFDTKVKERWPDRLRQGMKECDPIDLYRDRNEEVLLA